MARETDKEKEKFQRRALRVVSAVCRGAARWVWFGRQVDVNGGCNMYAVHNYAERVLR